MDTEEHHLVALVAPGSVEAEVGRLQASLFAAHGLVSAQALPPLIPVSFIIPGAPTRGLLVELNHCISAPWRIRVTGTQWVEGSLYLGVDSAGTWAALRTRARELCGAEPRSTALLIAETRARFPTCEIAQLPMHTSVGLLRR